ncbi:MAG: hypothetical protein R3F30_11745 [Planctomycetota bacterium]
MKPLSRPGEVGAGLRPRALVMPLLLAAAGAPAQGAGGAAGEPQATRPRAAPDAATRDRWLRALVARARWPFACEDEVVAFFEAGDVHPGSSSVRLGSRLWHRGYELPLYLEPGMEVGLPFEGLQPRDDWTFDLPLGPGAPTLVVRLAGYAVEAGGPRRLLPTGAWRERAGARGDPPREDRAWALLEGDPVPRGPHLLVSLEGLDELLPDHERGRFLCEVLLPAFARASAARAPDPGAGRRGRAGFDIRRDDPDGIGRAPWHSSQSEGLPPLGLLVEDERGDLVPSALQQSGFDEVKHPQEAAVHRALLDRLCAALRWPLPDLRGGADDRCVLPDDAWDRAGLEEHKALDLGTSWLPGVTLPPGVEVTAPLAGAEVTLEPFTLPRRDGRAWLATIRQGRYRLCTLWALFHLEADEPPRLAAPPAGGFHRSAPVTLYRGRNKGPHVHLEPVGLFPGAPEREAFYVRWRLTPALLAAPSPLPRLRLLNRTGLSDDHSAAAWAWIVHGLPGFQGLGRVRERQLPGPDVRQSWILDCGRPFDVKAWNESEGGFGTSIAKPATPFWPNNRGGVLLDLELRCSRRRRHLLGPGQMTFDVLWPDPDRHPVLAPLQPRLRQAVLHEWLPALLRRRSRFMTD